jgi:hypothetical protein
MSGKWFMLPLWFVSAMSILLFGLGVMAGGALAWLLR